jgi:hypothetical protein
MTKARIPGTWSAAVTQIADYLGVPAAARAAGVGERTIYKWSDPDMATTPTLAQALALDLAFADAGGDGLPLLAIYQAAMECSAIAVEPCRKALVEELARASKEFGEAVEHSLVAARPSATRTHVLRAMTETAELEQATKTIARRLRAMIRRGAGPRKSAGNSL